MAAVHALEGPRPIQIKEVGRESGDLKASLGVKKLDSYTTPLWYEVPVGTQFAETFMALVLPAVRKRPTKLKIKTMPPTR